MRVFMLGWEFPPHISGGLGTACYGMTKGLSEIGVEVCFVLPSAVPVSAAGHVKLRTFADVDDEELDDDITSISERVKLHRVAAVLSPYRSPAAHEKAVRELLKQQRKAQKAGLLPKDAATGQGAQTPRGTFAPGAGAHYEGDLMAQINRYALLAVQIARRESFDVIHAHDWMTYPAAQAVAAAKKKPMVVHVHSTEFDRSTPHPVIALITEWVNADGTTEQRDEDSDLGGTMRLGGQECRLIEGSKTREIYGSDTIIERHRHRYEFNNGYRQRLQEAGLRIAGTSVDAKLVEIVELPDHPWFIGCQFHPEFTSTPRDGHALFSSFVMAAAAQHKASR